MNIQIFGKAKCFDTKKAERYFKERKIPYQYVDLSRYGMSPGVFRKVAQALGGWKNLLDPQGKDDVSMLIRHLADPAAASDKLLEHPDRMRTPVVRNGNEATVGYCPDRWKTWE
jgi:arsenate reductase-like glutaredoxin family protein